VGYVVEDRGHDTPCWVWQGRPGTNGYGKSSVDGRSTSAHRVVFEQVRGPIPEGMVLDHLCEVRLCVNPEHLDLITPSENTARSWRRGRHEAKRKR